MADPNNYNVSFGDTSAYDDSKIQLIGVQNIVNDNKSERKSALLDDLGPVDSRVERARILSGKDGLLENSCSWIFDLDAFKDWGNGDQGRDILWIHGDPGKGKTMITEAIIENLEAQFAGKSGDDTHPAVLAYFFCQKTDERLNTATAILKGLLYSIVQGSETCANYLLENAKTSRKDADSTTSFWSLWTMMQQLMNASSVSKFYFCIDALDECVSNSVEFLDRIISKDLKRKVRWMVTSRNHLHIRERLQRPEIGHISLEQNTALVARSVKSLIDVKVKELAEMKGLDAETTAQVNQHLQDNSQGTFLWVALVFAQLKKTRRVDVAQQLLEFPTGLGPLYIQMLDQVQHLANNQEASLCQQILRTVATVYQPQALEDMIVLCSIPHKYTQNTEDLQDLISQCGSFLILRAGKLAFVHQSAAEFFTHGEGQSVFGGDSRQEHLRLGNVLLTVLRSELKRDLLRLNHPGIPIDQVSADAIEKALRPCLQYASTSWGQHLLDAARAIDTNMGPFEEQTVYDFLASHFLNWLESLAWLKQIGIAVGNLEDLLACLEARPNPTKQKSKIVGTLKAFLKDAIAFLARYSSVIEVVPLQMYFSGLSFAPKRSVIGQMHSAQLPRWLLHRPKVESTWRAGTPTFEIHSQVVTCLKFSPDSTWLASGSQDGTIRIRDTRTSRLTRVLNLDSLPNASNSFPLTIEVSDDGDTLACVFSPSFVAKWTLSDGETCGRLVGSYEPVPPAVASVSAACLFAAFFYKGGQISVWDLKKELALSSFDDSRDEVTHLAISPGGNTIVSTGPRGSVVNVRRVSDGELRFKVVSLFSSPLNPGVTFSPHGYLLAVSVHEDSSEEAPKASLLLFKTESGDELAKFNESQGNIQPVFTLESDFIITVGFSKHYTVNRTSTDNWQTVRSVEARTDDSNDPPQGLAVGGDLLFSFHSRFVIALSSARLGYRNTVPCLSAGESGPFATVPRDGTILAAPTTNAVTICRPSAYLESVSGFFIDMWKELKEIFQQEFHILRCSHNRSRIAAAKYGFIWLLDITPTDCPKVYASIDCNCHYANHVEFSPDGQYVAWSTKATNTIEVCNANTAKVILELENNKPISWTGLSFSADSKSLAVVLQSDDTSFAATRAWDLPSGKLQEATAVEQFRSVSTQEKAETTDHGSSEQSTKADIGIGVDNSNQWLTWNGEKLLWLPVEFRPFRSDLFILLRDRLIIAPVAGPVVYLKVDTDLLSRADYMGVHQPKPTVEISRPLLSLSRWRK